MGPLLKAAVYSCYSSLIALTLPMVLLRLWFKSLRQPAYRRRIHQRFGRLTHIKPQSHDIWLHAVSLGEVIAAEALIRALLDKGLSLCVTTTTPSGSQYVEKRLSNRVTHSYCPYELPSAIKRFISTVQPKLVVIMETELWPNLIRVAKRHGIPTLIINARLSEQSFCTYHQFRTLLAPVLEQLTGVYAQSEEDRARWLALGLPLSRCELVGNMKFDTPVTSAIDQSSRLAPSFFANRPVWMAASTHRGEEAQIIEVFATLKQYFPTLILLLVPRHPERLKEISPLLEASSLSWQTRQTQPHYAEKDIFVLDTFGEMKQFYPLADVVFVGGSLVPRGGHNVLEPIHFAKPVITGPHTHNFAFIIKALEKEKAISIVEDVDALTAVLQQFFSDRSEFLSMLNRATKVVQQHQGSTATYVEKILGQLSPR